MRLYVRSRHFNKKIVYWIARFPPKTFKALTTALNKSFPWLRRSATFQASVAGSVTSSSRRCQRPRTSSDERPQRCVRTSPWSHPEPRKRSQTFKIRNPPGNNNEKTFLAQWNCRKKSNILMFNLRCLIVWPDWGIFERSWLQIFFKSSPNIWWLFGHLRKTSL